jgi:hypothetical protein
MWRSQSRLLSHRRARQVAECGQPPNEHFDPPKQPSGPTACKLDRRQLRCGHCRIDLIFRGPAGVTLKTRLSESGCNPHPCASYRSPSAQRRRALIAIETGDSRRAFLLKKEIALLDSRASVEPTAGNRSAKRHRLACSSSGWSSVLVN